MVDGIIRLYTDWGREPERSPKLDDDVASQSESDSSTSVRSLKPNPRRAAAEGIGSGNLPFCKFRQHYWNDWRRDIMDTMVISMAKASLQMCKLKWLQLELEDLDSEGAGQFQIFCQRV